MRRVLHTFALGGHASDEQIRDWADMPPSQAIAEMLTFDASNDALSPSSDATAEFGQSLETLQDFLSSDSPDNATCPDLRRRYAMTRLRDDGEVVLNNAGL